MTKCKNITDPSNKRDKDICYKDVAVVNRNFNICEKVEFISERIECYYAVAAANQDIGLCEKADVIYKDYTVDKERCYSDVAKAKQDETICTKISSDFKRSTCFWGVARVRKDVSLCEKVVYNKNDCYSSILK